MTATSPCSVTPAKAASTRALPRIIRRPFGSNAPSAICSGLEAVGSPDPRPWLDLGFWTVRHPLGKRGHGHAKRRPTSFSQPKAKACIKSRSGPCTPASSSPDISAFTANGEHVVRLEQRLGYVHKGIESLMQGASLEEAAKLAGRTSGDSTVAYSYAFAQAAEAALQIKPPPRAIYLRALMAELERLANHFGDIGAICNDATFTLMHAQTGILRERVLRAAEACFGHRLMMDQIVPGGVARDIAPDRAWRGARAARRNPPRLPAPDRALRQHRLAAGPHRHHRLRDAGAGAPVRRRRLCGTRVGPKIRRAQNAGLCAL